MDARAFPKRRENSPTSGGDIPQMRKQQSDILNCSVAVLQLVNFEIDYLCT
jgi:hypothetical protein